MTQLEKELTEELKNLKEERRYHNYFVKDPLQVDLEVPKWVLNERREITAYINDYRRAENKPEITEKDVFIMQAEAKIQGSKNPMKLYISLAGKDF